jgi:hypothetical protein
LYYYTEYEEVRITEGLCMRERGEQEIGFFAPGRPGSPAGLCAAGLRAAFSIHQADF